MQMLNIEFFVLITNLNAINAIEKWWEVVKTNLSILVHQYAFLGLLGLLVRSLHCKYL